MEAKMDALVTDYRDQNNVDEALNLLRIHPDINMAMRLYRMTLDHAYHQGRLDGAKEAAELAYHQLVDAAIHAQPPS